MASSINKRLFDAQIVHSALLKDLEISNANKVGRFLHKQQTDTIGKIAAQFKPPNTTLITASKRAELNRLVQLGSIEIEKINAQAFKKIRIEMKKIARYEVGFQKKLIKNATKPYFPAVVIQPKQAILFQTVFGNSIQGQLLKEWMKSFSNSSIKTFTTHARLAYFNGEGENALTRRLITDKNSFVTKSRRELAAISRTSLNHSANQAKELLYKQNPVITKFRYTSVIDGRTTELCGGRDGTVYREGERPVVPAHINCRSTFVPVLDEESVFGERQTISSTTTKKKLQGEFRRDAKRNGTTTKFERDKWVKKNIGTVPAKTTYDQWLRGQSPKFQREYLGPARAKLFTDGKLKLSQFNNQKTGRRFTLSDLKAKDPKAFKLADL